MSALSPKQTQFASAFAADTGLNPKVVGAWLLAEQSGSAAKYYERKGINNWLNIGNVDSSPSSGNRFSVWKDPVTAARESAAWMRGRGKLAHEYGKPASGIMQILSTAGQGPHRQIQAIARSGWASSGYNGGTTLSQLMGQVGDIKPGRPEGMAGRAQSASGANPELAYGKGNPNLGAVASLLFGGQGAGDSALRAAFQQRGAEPSQSIRMGQPSVSAGGQGPSGGGTTPKGLAHFDGKQVAAWIAPALEYARAHGWKGTVNSGYRSYAEQKRIYDSGVRPAAVPGTSNHEGTEFPRGAVDVSEAQALSRILSKSPYAQKLVYAGSKDPVHFSHPHGGSY